MALSFPVTLPAPAKINLCLKIIGRRPDGYHELQTAFQILDLADQLSFLTSDRLSVSETHGVPMEENLIFRAAKLLEPYASKSPTAEIRLVKRIPMGAGLGGGSSNAATTLVALNQLWECGLEEPELCEIGRQLGADVPVFVQGFSAWGEGVGERLTPIEMPEQAYLLVYPNCHVSTAEIFSHPDLTRDSSAITIARFLSLGVGNEDAGNDCEKVVCQLYPEVGRALNWLHNFGPAKMTGTGSCIFLPCESLEAAESVKSKVPAEWQSFVTSGVNQSKLKVDLSI